MDLVVLLVFAGPVASLLVPAILPQRTPRGRRYRILTFALFAVTVACWAAFLTLLDPAGPPAVYFTGLGLAILSLALCIFASGVCMQERKREVRAVEVPFQPARPDAE